MKAWIYIYTIVLAAGMMTALAQETKTNEVAVPPPTATPPAASEVKPPAVAPSVPTSAVPAQHLATPAPLKPAKAVVPAPMTATSAPAPAVVKEVKPPAVAPLVETNAVPAQTNITAEPLTPTNAAAPMPESSGAGHKGVWIMGVALLVVVGVGLVIFLRRRSHATPEGSLITSAMNEDQRAHEDKNAPPPMS